MKRRILTLLLTLVMVLSLLPGTALAVNDSSAPAVTYADLADINGTALVPDGAGENTELTVADAVRALLLWTGMTEQQLGSFPDDYLAQARSMGMIDTDTDADAPCTLAAYRQMKAVADQMYDALHADKLQPLYMNGMAQPIFPYTTGEVTEGYSNDESDIIRYCVYVETNYDTDDDGKLDLVKALVQIPRAAMEGNYKAATIYEARPYITGCNESMNPGENLGSEGYDISKLYSQPDKRVPAGTATTADAAAAADSSDWYYWNPYEQMYDYEDLNWYDYYLVRGFAVVECGGLGTKGSDGFETCGTDLEIDNPTNYPDPSTIASAEEPMVKASIFTPAQYIGNIMELCQERRGEYIDTKYLDTDRVELHYRLPLNEIIYDFFDSLKSRTRGYASFDYELSGYQPSKLVKLDILLNGESVDALSFIIHADKAYPRARAMVEKLKEHIPRQMFEVPIQAAIGGKVIARETVKALRKDVLAKCYGGDITRKKKLLEKQKEGKKRMRQFGSVEVPQEAFMAVLKLDS